MRQVFRVLAYVVAGMVVVQAAVMVYAIAGLSVFVDDGGVVDSAGMEQSMSGDPLFPEDVGLMLHGMNGMMIIPVIAVLLLVVSFFAGVRGAWKWGLAVFLLVVVQAALGLGGHAVPFLGALHGINALLLFTVALYTGWRVGSAGRSARAATSPDMARPDLRPGVPPERLPS